MSVRSAWVHVETYRDHKISIIEDINRYTAGMSITNDAENVLKHFQDAYGRDWRVVYKDTDGEWWEIYMRADGLWDSDFQVGFKPWHGLEWDILKR